MKYPYKNIHEGQHSTWCDAYTYYVKDYAILDVFHKVNVFATHNSTINLYNECFLQIYDENVIINIYKKGVYRDISSSLVYKLRD